MARVLVVYESKYGQTRKIANFIAGVLRDAGNSVDLLEAHQKEVVGLSKYDGVIVGGAVYASGFPRKLQHWVHAHSEVLNKKPTAFYSVCLGVMDKNPKVQKEEREIVQGFFRKTAWTPKQWKIFAGGLKYSKYNWIIKSLMKRIAKKEGADADTTHDYEYTNWNEVTDFTEQFLATLKTAPRSYEIPTRGGITSLDL